MIFRLKVFSRVRTVRPKLGVFSRTFKIQLFGCFVTQLVKKLQQWSLYDVIEDILPFVLNTKRPLSDIWLLRYKQNSFGCLKKKLKFWFFSEVGHSTLPPSNSRSYIFVTKYSSEAVLYSKQMVGYPVSHHIKTIAVAF